MGLYDQDRGEPSLRRDDVKRDAGKPGVPGADTLRATPFTDEVFDDREDRASASGGLSTSLMVGVALGAVLVAGVGWYAFMGPAPAELPDGQVQTIKADATPYKMKPDNPGGMEVENRDKLVYDRVAKGAAPKREENLLPPPEVPKEPPKAKAPEPAKAPETKASEPKAAEKAPEKAPEKTMESIVKEANEAPAKPSAPTSDAAALAAAVAAATGKTAAPPAKAPGADPAPSKGADPAPSKTEPAVTKPPEPRAPEPKLETQTAAVTPAAPTPAAPAAGTFQIQLVSVPTEEAAQSEWKRISGRHQDLFAALTPAVTKADLGEKGIYYRLRAGPLADKAAADQLCAALAADRIGCIVIKP